MLQTFDPRMSSGKLFSSVQGIGCRFGEYLVDQRTLARTRYPAYYGEKADGKETPISRRLLARAERTMSWALPGFFCPWHPFRSPLFRKERIRSGSMRKQDNLSGSQQRSTLSVHSRPGTDFKQVIARQQGVAIMLNHNYGISAILSPRRTVSKRS